VFEQGEPSKKIPVVDLCSDEEDFFPDTLRDEEFARKPFGDLNRWILRPPSEGNIIILSDSNEEEEVHEEDTANAEIAPPSIEDSSAPPVSTAHTDDAPAGHKMIVKMVAPLIRHNVIAVTIVMRPSRLRLSCQGGARRKQALKILKMVIALHC
jgi:hypothetical protein